MILKAWDRHDIWRSKIQHYVTTGKQVLIIFSQQIHIQAVIFSFDYLNALS